MRTAVIAFTKKGIKVARAIKNRLGSTGYAGEKVVETERDFQPIPGNIREFAGWAFQNYEGLIFISAVGIAVRSIAPHLRDKWSDPAIVVVDERGTFVISLLSGHWGGGNRLAQEVAGILGATPVITTASDLFGVETPESIAQEYHFALEARENLPRIISLLLEGAPVWYVTDDAVVWNLLSERVNLCWQMPKDAQGVIFVTDRMVEPPPIPFLILRPRNLVLGVGLRKGISGEALQVLVKDFFRTQGMALLGVREVASVEQKRGEPALKELVQSLSITTHFFTVEELQKVAHLFPSSPLVQRALGVGSVARPSAFLASGGGLEVGYFKGQGVALALFRRVNKDVDQSGGNWARE
ncbi:MAG: cobalt-precorrin 5A hydrolase [Atribacterota bacterium]